MECNGTEWNRMEWNGMTSRRYIHFYVYIYIICMYVCLPGWLAVWLCIYIYLPIYLPLVAAWMFFGRDPLEVMDTIPLVSADKDGASSWVAAVLRTVQELCWTVQLLLSLFGGRHLRQRFWSSERRRALDQDQDTLHSRKKNQQQEAVGFQSIEAGGGVACLLPLACMLVSQCLPLCLPPRTLEPCLSLCLPPGLPLVFHCVPRCEPCLPLCLRACLPLCRCLPLCVATSSTVSPTLFPTVSPPGKLEASLPLRFPALSRSLSPTVSPGTLSLQTFSAALGSTLSPTACRTVSPP